jgi:hypothetical protein
MTRRQALALPLLSRSLGETLARAQTPDGMATRSVSRCRAASPPVCPFMPISRMSPRRPGFVRPWCTAASTARPTSSKPWAAARRCSTMTTMAGSISFLTWYYTPRGAGNPARHSCRPRRHSCRRINQHGSSVLVQFTSKGCEKNLPEPKYAGV